MKGWAIARSPEAFLSRGFDRKEWKDVDVVLIVRPDSDMNDVCSLINDLLWSLKAERPTLQ